MTAHAPTEQDTREERLEPAESRAIADGAAQALRADRDLADAIRHRRPERSVSASYLDGLGRRRPLTPTAERTLVLAAQQGDRRAIEALVEAYLPRIGAMARHYRMSPTIGHLELVQQGVVGLLEALHHFDPERGVPFWGYARWWVRRSMQRLVAELGQPVTLSDHALRQLSRVCDAHRELVRELHREPTYAELAERTGLSRDQVAHLLLATRPPAPAQQTAELDDGGVVTFETIADPMAEGEYERVLDRLEAEELTTLLSALSERERQILRWRYGLDGQELGVQEIAQRLGLSSDRVRQIERHARAKLAAAARLAEAGAPAR